MRVVIYKYRDEIKRVIIKGSNLVRTTSKKISMNLDGKNETNSNYC
jgi:hypothetical protein